MIPELKLPLKYTFQRSYGTMCWDSEIFYAVDVDASFIFTASTALGFLPVTVSNG
jgi:hypothetical protein